MHEEKLYKGAGGELFYYANSNRKQATQAEKFLWAAIRGRKLYGFKFRRQHPIDDFIADFYCPECEVVVEIDGAYHHDISQAEYDQGRTYNLAGLGIAVIRFPNDEVLNNLPKVLEKISNLLHCDPSRAAKLKCTTRIISTHPSPDGEGPGMR
jgi:very-short-patch-repair endonuclease